MKPEKQIEHIGLSVIKRNDAGYSAARSERQRQPREPESKLRILQDKYSTLISAFYEVAERKVSLRDDYGDEQWDALDKEIKRVISKIETAEGRISRGRISGEYHELWVFLAESFREQHKRKKTENLRAVDCSGMSGVEFEAHVSRILGQRGFTDIRRYPSEQPHLFCGLSL